jgi:hypothetical protein
MATDPSGNVANANFVVTVNATQLPANGSSLSVIPIALAVFAIGLFLVGVTGASRRSELGGNRFAGRGEKSMVCRLLATSCLLGGIYRSSLTVWQTF